MPISLSLLTLSGSLDRLLSLFLKFLFCVITHAPMSISSPSSLITLVPFVGSCLLCNFNALGLLCF